MHILQIGLPKSGNFWLQTILNQSLQAAHIQPRRFIEQQPIYALAQSWEMSVQKQIEIDFLDITANALFYRLGNIFRYPVDDLAAYVQASTLVWSHSPYGPQTPSVLSHFDKVIYILRDPRDVAVSWANFVLTPYMRRYYPWHTVDIATVPQYLAQNLGPVLQDWCHHVGGYLPAICQQEIYCVFYERLVSDLAGELERLLNYLGIDLDANLQASIVETVQFQTMQKENPNHLRRGGIRQWECLLEMEQIEAMVPQIRSLLHMFNYEGGTSSLPEVPQADSHNISVPSGDITILTPAPH